MVPKRRVIHHVRIKGLIEAMERKLPFDARYMSLRQEPQGILDVKPDPEATIIQYEQKTVDTHYMLTRDPKLKVNDRVVIRAPYKHDNLGFVLVEQGRRYTAVPVKFDTDAHVRELASIVGELGKKTVAVYRDVNLPAHVRLDLRTWDLTRQEAIKRLDDILEIR